MIATILSAFLVWVWWEVSKKVPSSSRLTRIMKLVVVSSSWLVFFWCEFVFFWLCFNQ